MQIELVVINVFFIICVYFNWVVVYKYDVEVGVIIQFLVFDFVIVYYCKILVIVMFKMGWFIVFIVYLQLCLVYNCFNNCFGKIG